MRYVSHLCYWQAVLYTVQLTAHEIKWRLVLALFTPREAQEREAAAAELKSTIEPRDYTSSAARERDGTGSTTTNGHETELSGSLEYSNSAQAVSFTYQFNNTFKP